MDALFGGVDVGIPDELGDGEDDLGHPSV